MGPLDHAAHAVLSRYPAALRPTNVIALGNRGGFSGARLWRADSAAGPLCLRAWPPHETAERLAFRHALMLTARNAGLTFVPAVYAAADGSTALRFGDTFWELQEWLPGRADYRTAPSPARLANACRALALLHACWERTFPPVVGARPAVARRLAGARESEDRLRSGWRPTPPASLALLLGRARSLLAAHLPRVPALLRRWESAAGPLQPCLCDVWHDHLLFEGDRLRGLLDYGAVKVDTVAGDLARMLGSLVGEDSGWGPGLSAYREIRDLPDEEEALARVLDVTGVILSVATWLHWLLVEGRTFEDETAVRQRLGELLARMERS
jgi:homoserine kinase type II